ncbi:Erythroid differentiation-related factor [Thalictrum thalictroides]|uniref:Erythroid differentiation-related factor n=1 Tax=Thalictrum thalictroides TaxID=46969 RepID=A0A7J6WUX1_THATH|nr:Erythroid differentiation-related factor [Thalictrum thalictroides]
MATTDGELQCVGRLEIARPKPVGGFLCGSIPVSTDKAFHYNNALNSSALVPSPSSSSQSVKAPRYRMLPTETDLNTPPFLPNLPHEVLPVAAINARSSTGDLHWESSAISQNLARKCEALAVSGLAEYGDEIDVVAPTDILKQIFKIPYSKARLSIAVHRIGQTLVLNSGPDIEEGEKLVRRHSSQSKCADQSLFLNFAMHSVRAEACDCPPTQYTSSDKESSSTILPGDYKSREDSFMSSDHPGHGDATPLFSQRDAGTQKDPINNHPECSQVNQNKYWKSKRNNRSTRHDDVKKVSQIGEKTRCPMKESEKCRRLGNDSFLRVLFWQFHNFRMLLGSDLLLFSNEKYVAVSLHLWDVTRQETPLTWLEAWLDNIMASVPELAICYHQNGVVQGYELLKTDDIFLLKGISEDGTPAFHPQVVRQNGHSVLRFLQDNCKEDPGAYWLYKNAGEDVIQLFDLSVIPKGHSSEDQDRSSSDLPSLMHRGRRDSLFSLGTLLFRLAHRLSMAPNSRAKCARLFKKCFDFLDEQDHLVVRALAHEQFARLILKCYEELDVSSEFVVLESEVTVRDTKDQSSDSSLGISGPVLHVETSKMVEDVTSNKGLNTLPESRSGEASEIRTPEACASASRNFLTSGGEELGDPERAILSCGDEFQISTTAAQFVQTVPDPISTKLAAVHHVSQAIKSLRWKRQLQTSEVEFVDHGKRTQERSSAIQFSVCACGDPDCIEVCDIREWILRSKMDHKLWKLVLLLGESYLALGEAYKEDGQLHQALKVVDLACSVYGSMPQHLEDAQFISSMTCSNSFQENFLSRSRNIRSLDGKTNMDLTHLSSSEDSVDQYSSIYLFWAKAWTLVGDVYIEYHNRSKETSSQSAKTESSSDVKISTEVEKEVKRLKKKLGHFKQNCSTCSLINCSCQSDRVSSGNSASSSSGSVQSSTYGRKQSKKPNMKNSSISALRVPEGEGRHLGVETANSFENGCLNKVDGNTFVEASNKEGANKVGKTTMCTKSGIFNGTSEMHGKESEAVTKEFSKGKSGGIFKFLEGPVVGDADNNLSAAISCYDAARKAVFGLPTGSGELQSIVKKKGWACNELGRNLLGRKDLGKAELAFADAIKSFKEVSDHTNIILINCNLGHGRRALAEEMVSKMALIKCHAVFQDAYNQALETAKVKYSESLRYYGAARSELNIVDKDAGSGTVIGRLRNEVYTQLAHTYLKLGMLLAKEDGSAEVYENGAEDPLIGYINPCNRRSKKELRKRDISANDAIREALSIYESLGELRKQEAAYAYFQLGCYHRDSCLKFIHQIKTLRKENSILQKVKQYASLAERNWQKSMDYYGPTTHPNMHLNILINRSALSWKLSECLHSNAMLESALLHLLEARHLSIRGTTDSMGDNQAESVPSFRSQLQAILKKLLQVALSGSTSKCVSQASSANNKSPDAAKLRELYGMSLKFTDLSSLHAMYELWMP